MANYLLCPDVTLIKTEDKFCFESRKGLLIINRINHEISLEEDRGPTFVEAMSRHPISGILGIIDLISGPAVIIAKSKRKIGDVTSQNHGIFQLLEHEILPYAKTDHHLTLEQQEENSVLISMLNQVLESPHFYFSLSLDLSQNLQKKWENSFTQNGNNFQNPVISLFTQWDTRFVWNVKLLEKFIQRGAEFLPFCVPLIHGAIFIRQCSLNGKLFRYSVISRRSVRNCGTRYFKRGCDDEGNCANFVETEQVVESAEFMSSFVQTRGSIPLFWSQYPDLIHYKPSPQLESSKRHLDGFTKHFKEQIYSYGSQTIVNLIDHRGGEGILEKHFKSLAQTIPGLDYVAFDFHQKCANFKWDKLHTLILDLRPKLEMKSFFLIKDRIIMQRQNGVIRTNCMDCLDRTNVVQSLISLEFLQDTLTAMNILTEGQRLNMMPHFHTIFRNLWADHGDILSVQYAGTPALKSDFTRGGKRTVKGMWNDLINSLTRYWKNNFKDGFRQDALDYFLGKYLVNSSNSVCYYGNKNVLTVITVLPAGLVLCIAMVILGILVPSETDSIVILFLMFWFFVMFGIIYLIYKNSLQYVDLPRFSQLK